MSDEPEDYQEVYDEACRAFLEENEAAFTSFQKVTKSAEKEYYGRQAMASKGWKAASDVFFATLAAKDAKDGKP